MENKKELSQAAYQFEAKMPLAQAVPLGLQHVLAMFVGNLTPILIITGACGIGGGEFADLQVSLLQNAMLVAGLVTLVQLYAIGPVGGKVPIIMGTSSGFIGVSAYLRRNDGRLHFRRNFRRNTGIFLKAPAEIFSLRGNGNGGFVHRAFADLSGHQFLWWRE